MKTILCALFLFFSFSALAQYPFEKYPAVKYAKAAFRFIPTNNGQSRKAVSQIRSYRIELLEERLEDGNNVLIFHNNKLIKRSKINFDIVVSAIDEPLAIGDINGDGIMDFRIIFYNGAGSGLASSRVCHLYFFGEGSNGFRKIFFTDFYDLSIKERDFDGDGRYEIISQHYLSYKWHAYWVFDVYSYQKGSFINVDKKYHYPIITKAFQENSKYRITKKIPRREFKDFSLKLPEFYEQDR